MSKTKVRKGATRRYAKVQNRKSWYEDLPLLPIVVGVLLLIGAVIVIVVGSKGGSSTGANTIDAIPCQSSEQLVVHYHAHLSMIIDGNETVLPMGTGIDQTNQCLYWMHVHNGDGLIHIEAPKGSATRKFTLGNIFDIWKKPLSKTQVGDTVLTKDQKLEMFVDGKAYTGDPRSIVLAAHTVVVLEVVPPEVLPPPSFTFPAGV